MNLPHDDIVGVCVANDIAFLGLFGSHATGTERPDSDVDLLVRFSKPKTLLDLVRIERQLSEKLGRPVDLVTEKSLSARIRAHVLPTLKPIYADS